MNCFIRQPDGCERKVKERAVRAARKEQRCLKGTHAKGETCWFMMFMFSKRVSVFWFMFSKKASPTVLQVRFWNRLLSARSRRRRVTLVIPNFWKPWIGATKAMT